ncbi:GTP-binding protein [Candidatus Viridilinea mediisalina]|uniref:Gliding-motility protein MglA n=1 Tax=Candidatus Viridilinea mediisalina TaxID=2024553 RepID=A0A2A6RQ17_9CHLR|nr:ADP-ribosylation factor-like protein [Candidatus Viridilinea mediisalina]PDW05001.1 gliding-motility protein MglA [Candidatus Viridilinea mediisalina]
MFINWSQGEINLKIVYYGAGMSGKTTNLQFIYARTPQKLRSQLISLKTHQDRTLLFDFLQLEVGQVANLKPKFKLYTVPGQVYYDTSRRLILQGADGVVFVVDSQADRMDDNAELWRSMERHLVELGYDLKTFPIVVQINKRDVPNTLSIPEIRRRLPIKGYPTFEAVAIKGYGVFDTLKASMSGVIAAAHQAV